MILLLTDYLPILCAKTSFSKFKPTPSVNNDCDIGMLDDNQVNLLMQIQRSGDNFKYPVLK